MLKKIIKNGIYHRIVHYVFLFITPLRYFSRALFQDNRVKIIRCFKMYLVGVLVCLKLYPLFAVEFGEKWKTVELPTTVSRIYRNARIYERKLRTPFLRSDCTGRFRTLSVLRTSVSSSRRFKSSRLKSS